MPDELFKVDVGGKDPRFRIVHAGQQTAGKEGRKKRPRQSQLEELVRETDREW